MLRTTGLIALLTITAACLPNAQLSQDGIHGAYVVNGVDPLGVEYTGRLNISRGAAANDVIMEWIVTGAVIRGEGTVGDGIIAVAWQTLSNPRRAARGTAAYEILDDGRLLGTLWVDGLNQAGTETVFPDP